MTHIWLFLPAIPSKEPLSYKTLKSGHRSNLKLNHARTQEITITGSKGKDKSLHLPSPGIKLRPAFVFSMSMWCDMLMTSKILLHCYILKTCIDYCSIHSLAVFTLFTTVQVAFLVHGQVTISFVVSVCLSVCLCRVFLSHLWSDFDQTRTYVICLGLVVSPRI